MIKNLSILRILFALAILTGWSVGQTVLMPMPRQCFQDVLSSGKPLAGGKIFTYQAGTSTPQATFTDATGLVANSNPVILDAAGCWTIWLTSGQAYRFVAQNSFGVQEWVTDQVSGLATVGSAFNQAITTVSFSATPTFTATGQYQLFKMTLTGNVTSSTLTMTGVTTPSIVSFELTQNGTGNNTFAWPLNVTGAPTINLAANAVTTVSFLWDGTTAWPWNYAQTSNTAVTFSATPTFTATLQNQLFSMTLTGNVSSSTLNMAAVAAPAIVTFELTQDATGGRSFSWPSNVIGPYGPSPIPSSTTTQEFIWDGTNARAIAPGMVGIVPFSIPLLLFRNTSSTVHTGDTSLDTIYTAALPVLSPTSTIRVFVQLHDTVQGAGSSALDLTLNASTVFSITLSSGSVDCQGTVLISNQNSVSVQTSSGLGSCATVNTVSAGSAAVNTGTTQNLLLQIQNANNTDSQTVKQFIVELLQ